MKAAYLWVVAWIAANPTICKVLLIPLTFSCVNALLRPRTPEEYAKYPPRFSAFLKLLRRLFPDPQGVAYALVQVIFGTALTPYQKRSGYPPPMPPEIPLTVDQLNATKIINGSVDAGASITGTKLDPDPYASTIPVPPQEKDKPS